jgi:3-oxoacyl-[acyl-carrier protein] reductase
MRRVKRIGEKVELSTTVRGNTPWRGLRRQWACELGQHGIRVVTIKTGGVPESIDESVASRSEVTAAIEQASLLKRAAQLSDVGHVAAFVASDQARTMTASTVNISCGALMDY